MEYVKFPLSKFFEQIDTESKAIALAWQYKDAGQGHRCYRCKRTKYYQHKIRPEIRECVHCGHQSRLRANSIFQHSKLPMLIWMRGIYLMMMGKRGISALELQRQLGIKSYRAALVMLRKIRFALHCRDQHYKLEGVIELDGTQFGRRETNNDEKVLVAVESRNWIDNKGRERPKAGFAKIYFAPEQKQEVTNFIEQDIRILSEVHTDSAKAFEYNDTKAVNLISRPMLGYRERLEKWLPWVQKFVFNAKSWIRGTHHGVNSRYFELYLAEYTYRFNRRHDVSRFFSRALFACTQSGPYCFP